MSTWSSHGVTGTVKRHWAICKGIKPSNDVSRRTCGWVVEMRQPCHPISMSKKKRLQQQQHHAQRRLQVDGWMAHFRTPLGPTPGLLGSKSRKVSSVTF